jgi:large subunit ribosomal protein L15
MKKDKPAPEKKRPQAPPHKHAVKKVPALKIKKVRRVKRPKKAAPDVITFGLHNLPRPKGAHKKRKYLGRGPSSGHGKTSTRGSKGQTSRAGRHFYLGFEGGQTPIIRRIPKRGFASANKKIFQLVNLKDLAKFKEAAVNPELLEQKGLVKDKTKLIKILGDGEIKNPLNVSAHAFSKNAEAKIKSAGGTVEVLTLEPST